VGYCSARRTKQEQKVANATSRRLDKLARKIVPSTVLLSQNKALMRVTNGIDRVIAHASPEFRGLPPNHMRVRTGVGNQIIFNQPQFMQVGSNVVMFLFGESLAGPDSRIVDIGSGCGRLAFALRRANFRGQYIGIDVDKELTGWCQENLTSDHMRFIHADAHNELYNADGTRGDYRLPIEDGSVDLVTSQSLLTHLLSEDTANYLRESARVLRQGGHMAMTVFSMENIRTKPEFGTRWTFSHRVGDAHVEDPNYPEAAVAYSEDWLVSACERAGFKFAEVRDSGGYQAWLIATR
jgi:SAM-dependent methyltransferase